MFLRSRPDFCIDLDGSCSEVQNNITEPIAILHGNRQAFQSEFQFNGKKDTSFFPIFFHPHVNPINSNIKCEILES